MSENKGSDSSGCCCLAIVIIFTFMVMGGKVSVSINNTPTNVAPVVSMSLEAK